MTNLKWNLYVYLTVHKKVRLIGVQTSPSCVEQLLHFLKTSGEEKNTLLLANSFSKLDFIISFNDKYLTEFEFLLDTTRFIEAQNEILVLKFKNNELINILEFRPEEKDIFKKYFNIFFQEFSD